MSIAWGSLVLLFVLLPGVLFFVGLYMPEKFTRDAVERSALGQLAAVLFVSLCVHGTFYWISPWICGSWIPCMDLEGFVAALLVDRAPAQTAHNVVLGIADFRGWILLYLLLTAASGTGLGYLVGFLVVRGRLRFLTQHRWVYKLSVGDQLTTAWIMTHIRQDDRVVVYRGFLSALHLKRDGTFSYVVLTHVSKLYLVLEGAAPITTPMTSWRMVGDSLRSVEGSPEIAPPRRLRESLLVIEGEDIANIVFDRYEVAFSTDMSEPEIDKAFLNAISERADAASARE